MPGRAELVAARSRRSPIASSARCAASLRIDGDLLEEREQDLDAQRDIVASLRERTLLVVDARLDRLGVRGERAKQQERARSERCRSPRLQRPASRAIAHRRGRRPRSSASAPPSIRRARSSGCSAGVSLHAASYSSAADSGAPRRLRQRRGLLDRAAAPSSGGARAPREMACTLLRLTDDRSEPAMQCPSPARGQRSVDRRRQQGMREPQPIAVRHQDAGLLGLERAQRPRRCPIRGQLPGSRRSGARARQRPMPRPAPRARVGRRGRSGDPAGCAARGAGHRARARRGPAPGRAAISSAKNGLPPEASATRTSIGRERLRPSRDRMRWCRAASDSGPSTRCSRLPGASARSRSSGLAESSPVRLATTTPDPPRQPPDGELERAPGGLVHPLRVVDRDDEGITAAEDRQHGQERARRRPRVGRLVRLPKEQRHFECLPLRWRQGVAHLVEDAAHEVAEDSEREVGLGLGWPGLEHPVAVAHGPRGSPRA